MQAKVIGRGVLGHEAHLRFFEFVEIVHLLGAASVYLVYRIYEISPDLRYNHLLLGSTVREDAFVVQDGCHIAIDLLVLSREHKEGSLVPRCRL